MHALLAILSAILGAVVGYVASFVVAYPIFVAIDGPDRDGGIAMGIAVTVGPLMAVVAAVLFLVFVLKAGQAEGPAGSVDKS